MTINTHLSIVTLNVSELNAPLRMHRVAEWIKKQNPYICCRRLTSHLKTKTVKVRGWKKVFHANGNQKKAGVTILM